jgi:predicted hotdog family 3-hydroxylacyl-ACP dehydratase
LFENKIMDLEEISSLIPHKGRMLLLSRVNEYNQEERSLCAEYHITENCLFFDPSIGGVPAWVGFEFMAQAISVLSGLRGRARGEKPKIGFIMSISSMTIEIPIFKLGSIAEIKVNESGNMDLVYSFDGEIFIEGKRVMEGKLTVMDANDEHIISLKKGMI